MLQIKCDLHCRKMALVSFVNIKGPDKFGHLPAKLDFISVWNLWAHILSDKNLCVHFIWSGGGMEKER